MVARGPGGQFILSWASRSRAAFSDVAQSVRDDVGERQKDRLLLPGLPISGFIYDVKTGRLQKVV